MDLHKSLRAIASRTIRLFLIVYFENKSAYERTKVGLLWIPASTVAFVVTLTLVFGPRDSVDPTQFFLYVFIGYSLWIFILDTITQSANIIQGQIDFANHNRMSLFDLYLKNLVDRLFRHLMNVAALFLFAGFLTPHTILLSFLFYILLLFLLMAVSFGLSYLINYVTLVFPDTEKAIHIVARFLFFLSPVFWMAHPEGTGARNLLLVYNPVSYFLSITRQIFFVEPFNLQSWIVAVAMAVIVCVSGYICYRLTKNHVRNIS